jgi:hypothetical protein
MKMNKKWLVLGAVSFSALAVAACSNKSSESQSKPISMPTTYSAPEKATKAGNDSTLNAAEVVDAPFTGITLAVLQDNVEDSDVYSPGGGDQLFKSNKDFKIVKGGLANLKLDRKTTRQPLRFERMPAGRMAARLLPRTLNMHMKLSAIRIRLPSSIRLTWRRLKEWLLTIREKPKVFPELPILMVKMVSRS